MVITFKLVCVGRHTAISQPIPVSMQLWQNLQITVCPRHHPSSDQGWRLNNLGNSILVVKLPSQELYHYVRTCLRVVPLYGLQRIRLNSAPVSRPVGIPRGCEAADRTTSSLERARFELLLTAENRHQNWKRGGRTERRRGGRARHSLATLARSHRSRARLRVPALPRGAREESETERQEKEVGDLN